MPATTGAAGGVVAPRSARQAAASRPGPVGASLSEATVHIETLTSEPVERDGRLMLATRLGLIDDELRALRLADQR